MTTVVHPSEELATVAQYQSQISNVEQPATIATVAAADALTSGASVGVPTKVEFDKVVADLVALRATVVALRTQGNASVAAQITRGDIAAS